VILHGFNNIPLQPMLQDTLFFGEGVPVLKIGDAGNAGNNPKDAKALAQALGNAAVLINGGHGFNVVATSLGSAIQRARYVKLNAEMQAHALAMGIKPPYLKAPANAARDTGAYEREWEAWRRRTQFTK
jgi:ribulose-5-phosphate 4-epimerase/fuculose-1-phosphate aldolase